MFRLKVLTVLAGCACIACGSHRGSAQTLPPSTAIPVVFTHSIQAGQARPGERIVAKTSQVVLLPSGRTLPAGTALVGHIVLSEGFAFDATPYAVQKPSVLSLHFDTITANGAELPVNLAVRAIAGPIASHEAEIPHYRDEIDSTGTRVLIGGSSFSPLESAITAPNGDLTGYHRGQGVFARLMTAEDVDPNSRIRCDSTDTEQSTGIFSADACGVYGLNAVSLTANGADGQGTFVLESSRKSVELYAGSSALLQVTER